MENASNLNVAGGFRYDFYRITGGFFSALSG
jgi:hypothetical protein